MRRLARMLLTLAIPVSRHRTSLIGDLDEIHTRRCTRYGRMRAGLWYWSEALNAVLRYTTERLRTQLGGRPPSLPKRSNGNTRASAMETLRQDIAFAFRTLRKSPGFTAVAALTIALGIGATTTIFSVANSVLFRAPPGMRDHDRLVTAHRVAQDGSSFHAFSWPNYEDYRDGDNGLIGLAAFRTQMLSLARDEEPQIAMGFLVSHNYFDVLGTRPALGRFFVADEGDISEPKLVAVMGHRLWQRNFDGDSSVIGQTIIVNRSPFTIIGVAEEGFSGHATLMDVGLLVPMNALQALGRRADLTVREQVSLELVGRLQDGVTVQQAQQAMDLIAQGLAETHPEANRTEAIDIRAYTPMIAGAAGVTLAFMALLFVVAGVILLIASVNVGGMLLSRASTRGKEMALRLAVGAPHGRLVRQLLTESVVLFLVGGGLGVALTLYTTRLLNAFQFPFPLPVLFDFSPDLRALGFSLTVALVTGIVFGLAPALHVTKPDLNTVLKEDATTATRSRLRNSFVVAQVAGSALLLVGAGLFLRALARADSVELGMDPDDVHVTMIDLSIHNYTNEESQQFYDDLMLRVSSLPNVEVAGMTDLPPLSMGNQTTGFNIEGREQVRDVGTFSTDFALVTPAYFAALRIPLLQGRTFTAADRIGASEVVMINETVARRVWPGEEAVGKHILYGSRGGIDMEVVGVVRTGKYRTVGEEDRFMVYRPYAQSPTRGMAIMVRGEREGAPLARPMRDVITSLAPGLPLEFNTSYRDVMGIALLPNQAAAGLATLFGALGLLLASVGLYGVLAFSVAQRTREIGIRLALGARQSQVRSMILSHGAKLAAIGLAVGFAMAAGVTRLLRGLLFGVSPTDPVTFAGIGALLMSVALIAAAVPAIRATRTNPVEALRE